MSVHVVSDKLKWERNENEEMKAILSIVSLLSFSSCVTWRYLIITESWKSTDSIRLSRHVLVCPSTSNHIIVREPSISFFNNKKSFRLTISSIVLYCLTTQNDKLLQDYFIDITNHNIKNKHSKVTIIKEYQIMGSKSDSKDVSKGRSTRRHLNS